MYDIIVITSVLVLCSGFQKLEVPTIEQLNSGYDKILSGIIRNKSGYTDVQCVKRNNVYFKMHTFALEVDLKGDLQSQGKL